MSLRRKSAGAAVCRCRFAMGPGFRFVAGLALGWSLWATRSVADSYGMGEDLLLRYRPFEADMMVLWHVPLGAGFALCAFRLVWLRCRGESAEAGRWIFPLVGFGLAWLVGWAALEFLLSLTDREPWWAPGRQER